MDEGTDKINGENSSVGNDAPSLAELNRDETGGKSIQENTTKRGRGRPPGSKNKNRSVDTSSFLKSNNKDDKKPDNSAQAKFLAVGFVALVELGESLVHSNCERKIERKFPSKLEEFKSLAKQHALNDKEKEILENSVSSIAERHDWMTKYAPELLLGVTLSQYAVRQLSLMRFVNNVTRERKKTEATTLAESP